jgi:multiple sugar transport system permease protein
MISDAATDPNANAATLSQHDPSWRERQSTIALMWRTLAFVLVLIGAVVLMVPFAWMISSSLKPLDQIFVEPPVWIPNPIMWVNYYDAWTALPFTQFLFNTLFITLLGGSAGVFTSALVAYGFARFNFRGRDTLFVVLLATMMLPYVVTVIPGFLIWRQFNLINTYDPLVFYGLVGGGAFYIFLMRQFMVSIPPELEEAARMDGANTMQIFLRIVLPLVKPALLAVAIFSFQGYWNEFLGPLLYLNDMDKYTMTLGTFFFVGGTNEAPKWHWLMAMSTLIAVPILAIFFAAQKQFIEGITMTGLKG